MFDMSTIGRVINLGSNVKSVRDGDKLYIELDLSESLGASKSGKSELVASTQGNRTIPGTDVKLGINCYRDAH
jgi:hypothetical protein